MDVIIIEFSPCDKGKIVEALRGMGNVTGNYGSSELHLATSAQVKAVNRALVMARLQYPFYLRLRVD